MIKNASPYTLTDILSKKDNDECLYVIPPYQRAYAWTKTEWEELFNDLLSNDKGYFLGSLICIGNPNEYKVIDGQQRLTTLSILLSVIYQQIESFKKNFASEMSDENMADYLWLKKTMMITNNQCRLTLSVQNENENDWFYLVKSISDNKLQIDKPSNFGNRRISKAYEYFKVLINNQITKLDDENCTQEIKEQAFKALFEFLEKIKSAMLIRIETDNEQSAFLLFESLNNRGVPLSPIDLIKNKILEKMNGDIEKNNENWQKILKNIGEKPNLQERFLRHFYMTYADILPEPPKDKEGNLTIPKVTKSNLIDFYNKQIDKDVQFVFDNLIQKSEIYGLLINPNEINGESKVAKKYQEKLINLHHLGISSAYMLLSFVFEKYKEQDFTDLLEFLEFWFICRHVTNEPATHQLDKIFTELTQTQKQHYDFDCIKSTLSEYLDRDNIKQSLSHADIYEYPHLVRNILIRLEQNLRNKQTAVDFWERTNKQLVWTIEHIYPQNPNNEKDWGDDEQNEQLKQKLHSLGNLTLTCYNGSYSNKKYAQKCQATDDGKPVGLINGDIKINQTLPAPSDDNNVWTAKKIDKRTQWLIGQFLDFLDKR